MRGDFHVFEMAAHTITEEGFCHLKTLLMESGMSAEDFAWTLLFCRLQIASTVNNFSSEKMISLVSVPAFNLLTPLRRLSSYDDGEENAAHPHMMICRLRQNACI